MGTPVIVFVCRSQLLTTAQQCGFTKVVSVFVCKNQLVVAHHHWWVQQNGVSVYLQESVVSVCVCRNQSCQCLFAGISCWRCPISVGSARWCQCLLAGISDVNVCVQESVMSVFVYRNQWCQCLFAGINGIDVCLQESVVSVFVAGISCCWQLPVSMGSAKWCRVTQLLCCLCES